MKSLFLASLAIVLSASANAQTEPNITSWLFNTTGIMGQHYVAGNSTPIQDNVLANVQTVQYSANWVYVTTHGIPAYITGPFQDGNPSLATDQNAIYRIPRVPTQNTGTATATTPGNIGFFINGVSLFDYRDGVAWNANTNALCGGPGNPTCPGGPNANLPWNRDAIPAERDGFDCAKAHPAMGNYHHHQNPSAFNLDLVVVSDVCDLYAADGLYVIDAAQHSPLVGYSYDGFPIYGAYGYANTDGTGGITRIRSGYQLRNITVRNTSPTGASVTSGAPINTTYPLGYFREDNEYVAHTEPFYLDEHNGRFAVTPEYPNGTYAYYCTVDENWNSAYPYVIGPTFYGNVTGGKVTAITESTTTVDPLTLAVADQDASNLTVNIHPNPATDLIAIQVSGLTREDVDVSLIDMTGKVVRQAVIVQGSSIWHLDTRTLYEGQYIVRISNGNTMISRPVQILK
ncbi:MAG: YHYH protein [Flavobacteriales bacterium]|nr:YHYH protein [Flavobacteriales bacterium]MBK9535827.1 YHYH protein [Flavobacteriales bacterium]HQX29843.1 YHYH protein [Flavobacteriales bacterium]HQX36988.1 YHYH protein [Flavobacteriales bacterium]